jgi:P-type E1-E2 ATPase
MTGYPHSRQTQTVNASDLQVGDYLLVAPGEQIPADGVVLEGRSECDEALMTASPILSLRRLVIS